MKPCVFIHTNHKQHIGALVSLHSMQRNSRHADKFDVKLIEYEAHKDFFGKYEGREYNRDGDKRVWDAEDLQSFTPLRFMPPELMGYEGKAVVVDPDVFAIGDVWELLARDMGGKPVMCRTRGTPPHFASSVMLLDCAKLRHWRLAEGLRRAVHRRARVQDLDEPGLRAEGQHRADRARVERLRQAHAQDQDDPQHPAQDAALEVGPAGRLHSGRAQPPQPGDAVNRLRRKLFGTYAFLGAYKEPPGRAPDAALLRLAKEALENGLVSESVVKEHMAANHVRHDAFDVIKRTPPVEQVLPKAA